MDAQQIATETGTPVGQPPAEGQAAGPMAGPPVDPAAAAAAAGGQAAPAAPVDPAADPMGGAAQQPQTIEEMAAAGDPISTAFVALTKKVDLLLEILMTIADKVHLQMPASQSYQTRLKEIDSGTKSASVQIPPALAEKTFVPDVSTKLGGVLDDTDDDLADDVPAPKTSSMGTATLAPAHNKFITSPRVATGSLGVRMSPGRRGT